MGVTPLEVRQQIILEVGDVDPRTGDPPAVGTDGVVASRIDYLWERFAAWDQVAGGLRELHCRQSAIRLVLAVLAPRRFDSSDSRGGLSVRAHQLVESYQEMLADVGREIATAKASANVGGGTGSGASSPYQAGRLVHRVPLPAARAPDPNHPTYGGMLPGVVPSGPVPDDAVTE